jgi:hypothetical protein
LQPTQVVFAARLRWRRNALTVVVACGRIFSFQAMGPQKKKNRGPPWWVGGSEYEKGLGWDLFFRYFFNRVFELPSSRNAQKRDKKSFREKVGFGFLVEFFVNFFRHDFFCKTFFVVFLNSHR